MRVALYARGHQGPGSGSRESASGIARFREAEEGRRLDASPSIRGSGLRQDGESPAFRRLFEDASRKEFDLVLFWSLDRFSREGVLEPLQHLQRLSGHGVGCFSYREEYLRSEGVFKEVVLAILAGGQHAAGPHEAWIAADPLRGGFKVLITGPHGLERAATFAVDEDRVTIAERVREMLEA